MKKDVEKGLGKRVRIVNKHQINYPLRGIVVAQTTEPDGFKLSKVQFRSITCWYADADLQAVVATKEELEDAQERANQNYSIGIRTVSLQCPVCETIFLQDIKPLSVTHVPCVNGFCDKAVSINENPFQADVT